MTDIEPREKSSKDIAENIINSVNENYGVISPAQSIAFFNRISSAIEKEMITDITEALQKERTARVEAENALRAYELDIVGYPLTERVKQLEQALRECLEAMQEILYDIRSEFYEHEKIHKFASVIEAKKTLKKHKHLTKGE